MNLVEDKILGSWLGLAIGDAMGSAVRGMKPATVVQCFKTMDDFKDVRPYIGKGVKQYRMKGLYGAQTQTALAGCDVLIRHKGIDPDALLACLSELKQTGPDLYFGVFRRPEASLQKILQFPSEKSTPSKVDSRQATATFLTLSVPIALYHRDRARSIVQNILESGRVLHCPKLELAGMLLMAQLVDHFLQQSFELGKNSGSDRMKNILREAVQMARNAEKDLETLFDNSQSETISDALSKSFQWLFDHSDPNMELKDLLKKVCENASQKLGIPVSHAAQGTVLTLLPTAVVLILRSGDFAFALTQALNLGGEGDKLGAITGALAGALYGFKCIPKNWHRNLVNSKEMKIRGEALIQRRKSSKSKNLLEMESGLTFKEAEERKRFLFREPKKKSRSIAKPEPLIQTTDTLLPERENRKGRRQYERDKSRKKRDRRKKPDSQF